MCKAFFTTQYYRPTKVLGLSMSSFGNLLNEPLSDDLRIHYSTSDKAIKIVKSFKL